MTKLNSPNWRGKVQPKRDRCPACGKRGLGPIKQQIAGSPVLVGQDCRYCQHFEPAPAQDTELQ